MRLTTRERILFYTSHDRATRCWNWTGALSRDGYGLINATDHSAHRSSYIEFVGPIPDGLQLDHLCRNRKCVNPEHLEPVTARENTSRGSSATKTECVNGHPYDSVNTRIIARADGTSRRDCRVCSADRSRKYSRRMKQQRELA